MDCPARAAHITAPQRSSYHYKNRHRISRLHPRCFLLGRLPGFRTSVPTASGIHPFVGVTVAEYSAGLAPVFLAACSLSTCHPVSVFSHLSTPVPLHPARGPPADLLHHNRVGSKCQRGRPVERSRRQPYFPNKKGMGPGCSPVPCPLICLVLTKEMPRSVSPQVRRPKRFAQQNLDAGPIHLARADKIDRVGPPKAAKPKKKEQSEDCSFFLVDDTGFEPVASRTSSGCSYQLS